MFTSYGACKEKEGRLNKRDREIVCVCVRVCVCERERTELRPRVKEREGRDCNGYVESNITGRRELRKARHVREGGG